MLVCLDAVYGSVPSDTNLDVFGLFFEGGQDIPQTAVSSNVMEATGVIFSTF
jgi:hypothetical protein